MVYVHKSGLLNDGKRESTDMKGQQTTDEFWIVPIRGTGISQSSQVPSLGTAEVFGDDGFVMTAGTWLLFSECEVEIPHGPLECWRKSLVDGPTTEGARRAKGKARMSCACIRNPVIVMS
jgi:hypothetical protein